MIFNYDKESGKFNTFFDNFKKQKVELSDDIVKEIQIFDDNKFDPSKYGNFNEYFDQVGIKSDKVKKKIVELSEQYDLATVSGAKLADELSKGLSKTDKVLKSLAVAGKTFLSAIGTTIITTLASMAVSGIIKWLDEASRRTEILIEKGKEASEAVRSAQNTYAEKKEKTENLPVDRYIELSEGVDTRTNENISLTNSEYEEYLSLCNEIAAIHPSLVSGYTDQGTAILSLGSSAAETTAKLTELLEKEKEAAAVVARENAQAEFSGAYAEYGVKKEEIARKENFNKPNQGLVTQDILG